MHDSKTKVEEFGKLCAETWIVNQLFTSLFEAGQSQLDLFTSIAPYCFGDLCNVLHQYVILQFTKLTDPAKTGRHANLTSNYVVEELAWPDAIRRQLTEVNGQLMDFRKYIEKARSKRIAHTDMDAQLVTRESLGAFPKNAERQFLRDLQKFVNIAYGHVTNGQPLPIDVAGATDTDRLVRALTKSVLFDQCSKCGEIDRSTAVLDYKDRQRRADELRPAGES
jgi:hypothetical protein